MKISPVIACITLAMFVIVTVCSADVADPWSPYYGSPITGKVFVSSATFDPAVFFSDDKGIVTYIVTNGNTNNSVKLNHVSFSGQNIKLLSKNYDTTSTLGPLQSRSYTFTILADAPVGDYYPEFTMSFYDTDLQHKSHVQIDNSPLELTLVDKPDAFLQGKKKTIYMQVANPRKNEVRSVVLEVSGAGITAVPSRTYIGNLASGAKIPVNFSVTPDQETTLALLLTYNNGNNPHKVTMDIPITFGIDKKQADPVMSNVVVTTEGMMYRVTGDVTNAGLETANAVMVTALPPAVPEDPYKTYVVQALKPDDFGSFEITFSTDGTVENIPVQITYKDSDGNIYTSVQNITVPDGRLSVSKDNGPPLVPIIAGLVIVALFVGGWFFYLRKKKQ